MENDGKDFIEMWQAYFYKMAKEGENMLPLKRVAFLGNNVFLLNTVWY